MQSDIAAEVIAHITEPVFVLTPCGRVVSLNPAAMAFCGLDAEHARGLPIEELVRLRDDPRAQRLRRLLEAARYHLPRAGEPEPVCEDAEFGTEGTVGQLRVYPVPEPEGLPRTLVLVLSWAKAQDVRFSLTATRWQIGALRRIEAALHGSRSTGAVVDTLREIFETERAWLIQIRRPRADRGQLVAECTDPEFPGAMRMGVPVDFSEREQRVLTQALMQREPTAHPRLKEVFSRDFVHRFRVESQLQVPVRLRAGVSCMLGMHACRQVRDWGSEERALLAAIGRRLTRAAERRTLQLALGGRSCL